MLFNTVDFVVFFFIVVTVVSIIKYRKFQHLFLLAASYFFFYFSNNFLVSLLMISTMLDYYVGQAIWKAKTKKRKKLFLIFSLVGNLGLLGFFKYSNFAIDQFNALGNFIGLESNIPLLEIVLPIGISFYTFQTLSYTIDIYRGHLTPSKSFWEFALFVAFFPSLVAGPIIRARDFLPQLREKIDNIQVSNKLRQIVIQNWNLKFGITLMAFGFLKKMFFADNIAPMVNDVFAHPVGLESTAIILGTIGFGIQVYGDFSGYSDIAIGAALILGIKIKPNFNKPFFATSPTDFWNRWHISLSSWVRDYLYLPLVFYHRKSNFRIFISLLITMAVLGLWHGAGWNFIIFGIMHGLFMGIHRILLNKFPLLSVRAFFKTKFGKILSIFITQYLVFFTFIAFRVPDLNAMVYSMQKYVLFDFQLDGLIGFVSIHKLPIALMILFGILHFITYMKPDTLQKIVKLRLRYWTIFLAVVLTAIVFFFDGNPEDFIYFRF